MSTDLHSPKQINNIKDLLFHDSMCVLPWHGFTLFPNGDIKNCAISNQRLGNIKQNHISDILNNEKNSKIRNDMQLGVRNKHCNTCHRTEDLQTSNPINKISNRIWYMKVMKNHDLSVYEKNQFVNYSVLDLRWRNTCNYSCVYCDPSLSSKWAIERNKHTMFNIDEQYLTAFKQNILEHVKEIKHVYLAGGEPLLIKENLELLEALAIHNPDVTVRVNTNLSNINNKIFKLLTENFKNTKWTVSVDSMLQDYEYARYPGNWNNFLSNLTYLYTKTKNIDYNMTWSVLNAFTIFDAVDFLQEKFCCPDSVFVIQPIFTPKALHIGNLSDSVLDQLKCLINERMQKCKSTLYRNSLQSMLSVIEQPVTKKINKTIKYLEIINKKRSISFPKSLNYLFNKE